MALRKNVGKFVVHKLRQHTPTAQEMAANKYLAPIAHRFLVPQLWRFNRRSVQRGIALGLFAGFIIPIGQIFLAAFLSLPTRANVPLAALTTFITNPFTFPFWAYTANRIGNFVINLGDSAITRVHREANWIVDFFAIAGVTGLGFVLLAIGSAIAGYVAAGPIWRIMVARKRKRRLRGDQG